MGGLAEPCKLYTPDGSIRLRAVPGLTGCSIGVGKFGTSTIGSSILEPSSDRHPPQSSVREPQSMTFAAKYRGTAALLEAPYPVSPKYSTWHGSDIEPRRGFFVI